MNIRQHLQGAVRSEVKRIANRLLLAINAAGGLNAENGLHIPGRTGTGRAGKQHYTGPLFHSNAGSQLTAGQGDGMAVLTDGFPDGFQRIVIGLFLISFAGNIDDLVIPKHRVLFQHGTECPCFLYAG